MKKRFALILALLMMVSLLPGMAQALALAPGVKLNPDLYKISPEIKKNIVPKIIDKLAVTPKPIPVYATDGVEYHARVNCSEGYITMWDNIKLTGNIIGRFLHGEYLVVMNYSNGASEVMYSDGGQKGGFVKTAYLEIFHDENIMPVGDIYRTMVDCEENHAFVWTYADFSGQSYVATLKNTDIVYAQKCDNEKTSYVWPANGLTGYVETRILRFIEKVDSVPETWNQ